MKKILLVLFTTLISVAYGQVSYTAIPKYGCPNTTNNTIAVSVIQNIMNIPAGLTISFNISIVENSVTVGTHTSSDNTGWVSGTSKILQMTGVNFGNASTCTVTGTVTASGVGSYPVNGTYVVQYPPDLTATESPALTISVTGSTDYSVRFYTNQNYGTVTNETTGTTYAVTQSGDFSAKAYDPLTSCISQNPSNVVSVVTSIEEKLGFEVSVYPNPVVSELTLSTQNGTALSYEITDLKGNSLQAGNFSLTTKINTEGLQAGIYILKVKDASGKFNSYKLTK